MTREPACPTTCGADGVEPGEECDFGDGEDANCPGRCVSPGEEGECTCALIAGTCEEASDLGNGITEFPPTHGGWFTWVADVPSTAVNTCGSTGFDSRLFLLTGTCDSLEVLTNNDDCDDDPAGCCGADTDPLASCHPVGAPWESCSCIDTVPGQRYWAFVQGAANVGSITNIELDKRLECGSLFGDGGACCDGVGGCTETVEADCQGGNREWHAQKVCEFFTCRTEAIPTVSEWGLVVLTLLGLAVGTILFGRRRTEAVC